MQITSIVLHYKRPENVQKWMAGIRSQTIPSKVIVWDNSGDYPKGSGEDVLITSTENFHCWPRFLMAGLVDTQFIYNQDDDLAIKDPQLFEKFIAHSEKYPQYVIGWNGRIFSKDINWDTAYSFPGKGFVDAMDENDTGTIDMVNVGVSFLPTNIINQVPISPLQHRLYPVSREELKYADDIYFSKFLYCKRTMPFLLKESYEFLNEYEERQAALSKQTMHMVERDKMCKKLFGGKYK